MNEWVQIYSKKLFHKFFLGHLIPRTGILIIPTITAINRNINAWFINFSNPLLIILRITGLFQATSSHLDCQFSLLISIFQVFSPVLYCLPKIAAQLSGILCLKSSLGSLLHKLPFLTPKTPHSVSSRTTMHCESYPHPQNCSLFSRCTKLRSPLPASAYTVPVLRKYFRVPLLHRENSWSFLKIPVTCISSTLRYIPPICFHGPFYLGLTLSKSLTLLIHICKMTWSCTDVRVGL